ncbi:MAG: ubiquinol-cytochrome c reductase iron-sulfur subunit [Fidelibacterota bacterium]
MGTVEKRRHDGGDSRRSFLKILLGGGIFGFLTSVVYPVVRYLKPPPEAEAAPTSVAAGKASELKPNSGRIIKFGREPVILINTPSGDIRAFSAVCTHLACTVQYREDFQHIWCACHNGHYNLEGVNIAGPPPRPLAPFDVNISGDDVFVSKRT